MIKPSFHISKPAHSNITYSFTETSDDDCRIMQNDASFSQIFGSKLTETSVSLVQCYDFNLFVHINEHKLFSVPDFLI